VCDSLMPTGGFSTLFNLLHLGWPRNWNGLLIYLLNSDGVPDWSDGGTNPSFLGRKIEKREIVLASVVLLVHPIVVLIPSAITLAPRHLSGISNPFHGISQVVYEYASAGANNGSGFGGWEITLWWNLTCFSLWEDATIIALLLLADSMTRKQPVKPQGTLRTDSLLFTGVTAG